MTYAKVYRIVGDQTIGNAIVSGMQKQTKMTAEKLELIKNEIDQQKLREAINGVKKPRELRELKQKIMQAEIDYGMQEELSGVRKRLLQLYAMICLGIDNAYKHLSAINREA